MKRNRENISCLLPRQSDIEASALARRAWHGGASSARREANKVRVEQTKDVGHCNVSGERTVAADRPRLAEILLEEADNRLGLGTSCRRKTVAHGCHDLNVPRR